MNHLLKQPSVPSFEPLEDENLFATAPEEPVTVVYEGLDSKNPPEQLPWPSDPLPPVQPKAKQVHIKTWSHPLFQAGAAFLFGIALGLFMYPLFLGKVVEAPKGSIITESHAASVPHSKNQASTVANPSKADPLKVDPSVPKEQRINEALDAIRRAVKN